jgi:hypothetical protein
MGAYDLAPNLRSLLLLGAIPARLLASSEDSSQDGLVKDTCRG